jgi:hypothetical protein
MATDIIHSLDELNILFQDVVLSILGYTKSGSPALYSNAAYKAVRMTYPPEGAPGWQRTEDVMFISVLPEENDDIGKYREFEYSKLGDDLNEAMSSTRVLGVHFVVYGPNSYENSRRVFDCMFRDSYRIRFSEENLYLVPGGESPTRAPEKFQAQWWERTDFSIRFNEKIVENETISTIESAEIDLYDTGGLVKEMEIIRD